MNIKLYCPNCETPVMAGVEVNEPCEVEHPSNNDYVRHVEIEAAAICPHCGGAIDTVAYTFIFLVVDKGATDEQHRNP